MVKKKSFEKDATSFINNPAMQFISNPKEDTEEKAVQQTPPENYKLNPKYIEKKSRRVQILIQPSVYEAIKGKASSMGISTNEAICEALKSFTKK